MSATNTAIELERVVSDSGGGNDRFQNGSWVSSSRSPSNSPPPVDDTDRELASLPPADRGAAAWMFLLGATLIETTIWGLLNAVGVLQHYWTTEQFPRDEATVTLAAALMNGLTFMSAGVFGP